MEYMTPKKQRVFVYLILLRDKVTNQIKKYLLNQME